MNKCNYKYEHYYVNDKDKTCSRLSECPSKYMLRKIRFNDPFNPDNTRTIYLCSMHFNEMFDEIIKSWKELVRKAEQLRINLQKDLAMARKYDVVINFQERKDKIDQVWSRIKIIRRNQCRNPLCTISLSTIRGKFYSAILFSRKETVSDSLYFCSYNCWTKTRIRCGIIVKSFGRDRFLDTYL